MNISIPEDGWGFRNGSPVTPRRWQVEALQAVLSHYSKPNPSRGCIHAVTGSGKSLLLSAVCACIELDPGEVVVVTTSRQKLVKDISKAIKDRIEGNGSFMSGPKVGTFFGLNKCDINACKVIVSCNDSLGLLAESLFKSGIRCAYFICDELHRSQSKSMLTAISNLAPNMSLGLSATPYRANVKQEISSFDTCIYKYSIQEALDDKNVIVPWVTKGWDGGEVTLDEACLSLMQEENGYGVCNAYSIDDAMSFAKYCTDAGYPAKAVHSKQTDKENDEIIEELRTGVIKVVIYVDLLTEGIDLPYLRFLCMRRVVGSRNRFVQELGRGIRYFKDPVTGEEKKHVVLLDINDLMSVHRLNHIACLAGEGDLDEGGLDEDGLERNPGKALERAVSQQCLDVVRMITQAKAGREPFSNGPLASYLAQLCSVFDTFGLMEKPLSSREWRREAASEKQVRSMQNMKWTFGRKQVPSIHRTCLEMLSGEGLKFTRGIASDLLSIQMSLAQHSKWPKFSELDRCAKDGIERAAKKKSILSIPKPTQSSFITKPAVKMEQGTLFEISSPKGKQK